MASVPPYPQLYVRNPKPGPKRASKPKVRSGCKTCKLRRVKCDETKPECRRCVNYWGSCEGYDIRPPRSATLPNEQVLPVIYQKRILFPLLQPRSGPSFDNDRDFRYFNIFQDDTSVMLGGPLDSYIWGSMIPQASESEPFIRDALIAIGALTRTIHEIQRYRRMDIAAKAGEPCLGNAPDHVYAMKVYGRALKGMRTASPDRDDTIRKALIGCLLVVCFEGLKGSAISAMTHAQVGIGLLNDWMERNGGFNQSLMFSPSPHVIEDDLIYAFHRLDLQVLTYFDTRPVKSHRSFIRDTDTLKQMPSLFLSLKQSRSFFDLIMRRSFHFLATALHAGKADQLESLSAALGGEETVDLPAGVNTFSPPKEVPHWMEVERDGYLEEVSRWTCAFEPILKSLQSSQQKKSLGFLGAIILKINAFTARIMLISTFFDAEVEYDSLLPEFKEIAELAEAVYETLMISVRDKVSFHFDPAVLPALFVLVSRCRDRVLRRQVIALLCSSFHRESTWDSFAIARVGAWLISIEEEGVETEHIPDHRRARLTKVNVDLEERRVQLRCYQRLRPEDKEVAWKETVLRW